MKVLVRITIFLGITGQLGFDYFFYEHMMKNDTQEFNKICLVAR